MKNEMKLKVKKQLSLRANFNFLYCSHSQEKACDDCLLQLIGDVSELRGNVSEELRGDVSELRGDVSGLTGNVSEFIKYLKNIKRKNERKN